MSKSKQLARKDAPADVIAKVQDVIGMADKNRYSVSKVFAAHNAVFGLKDQPQSCTSCLTMRVAALRKWYGTAAADHNKGVAAVPTDEAGIRAYIENAAKSLGLTEQSTREEFITSLTQLEQGPHPAHIKDTIRGMIAQLAEDDTIAAPAEGVTRYPMPEDGNPLDFTPSADNALKGTILYADGSNVKAGTYVTADGTTIAVSVGNKATIKDDLI